MLRTNSKIVKQRIRKYILECARDGLENYLPQDGYCGYCTEQDIESNPMLAVERIFILEKGWEIERHGRRAAFIDWLQGLCSALPVYDGYYFRSRERLAEWLEETEAESMKYEDEDVDRLILNLYYREFEELLKIERKENGK